MYVTQSSHISLPLANVKLLSQLILTLSVIDVVVRLQVSGADSGGDASTIAPMSQVKYN